MLKQHLEQLRNQFCGNYPAETLRRTFANTQAQAAVLYALTTSYPRPLSLWKLIPEGLPEHAIDKDSAVRALWALQELRLVRVRRSIHLFLSRRGEALTPDIIAHFHSVH